MYLRNQSWKLVYRYIICCQIQELMDAEVFFSRVGKNNFARGSLPLSVFFQSISVCLSQNFCRSIFLAVFCVKKVSSYWVWFAAPHCSFPSLRHKWRFVSWNVESWFQICVHLVFFSLSRFNTLISLYSFPVAHFLVFPFLHTMAESFSRRWKHWALYHG